MVTSTVPAFISIWPAVIEIFEVPWMVMPWLSRVILLPAASRVRLPEEAWSSVNFTLPGTETVILALPSLSSTMEILLPRRALTT